MESNEENQTKVTLQQGIASAWCCSSGTHNPQRGISEKLEISEKAKHSESLRNIEENSFSKAGDSLTLIPIPGLSPLISQVKYGNMESKSGREIRRDLPSGRLPLSKKNSSEIWRSSRHMASNWDVLFDSWPSILESNQSASSMFSDNTFQSGLVESKSEEIERETDSESCQPALVGLETRILNSDAIRQPEQNPEQPECLRRKGEIFLMYKSKTGIKYTSAPWDRRIEEVAAWLNRGSSKVIPISRQIHPKTLVDEKVGNFRKQTLREVFGDGLNPEKFGITFFVGPVDGKVSFKMNVCDLMSLERATRHNRLPSIMENEKLKYVT